MELIDYAHGITAIDTGFNRPLFDASHLIVREGEAAFVDTGTNFSVPNLLEALREKQLEPEQVKYVLLTHVHLDHAGGAGELMRHLPNATAVLDPRGARHMIDPTRIVAGAIGVYGEDVFHRAYGEIIPIPEARVAKADDGERLSLGDSELLFLHTEGHCRHHYCIYDERADALFTGDSFGVSYGEFDTGQGQFIFPAITPTEFDPPAMLETIDRLMTFDAECAYLTHYSRVTELARMADDLRLWVEELVAIAERLEGSENRTARMTESIDALYIEKLTAHGVDMPLEQLRHLIEIDVRLNVAGIEVWLDRQAKRRARQAS